MRVRTPFNSGPQDNPPIDAAPHEDSRPQSVQWIFDHLNVQDPAEDTFDEDEMPHQVERGTKGRYRVALVAIVFVIIGAGGLFALSGMKARLSGKGSGTDHMLYSTSTNAGHAQSSRLTSQPIAIGVTSPSPSPPAPPPQAEEAISKPTSLPLPSLPPPEMILAPPQAVAENAAAVPRPTMSSPSAIQAIPVKLRSPPANLTAAPGTIETPGKRSGTSSLAEVAVSPAASGNSEPASKTSPAAAVPAPVSQATVSPVRTKLAAIVPRMVKAPVEGPLNVRLSFTADQSNHAAAFAGQLRREGFKVTSIVIPVIHGRWPGVAYFFDSDREKARLIARQLAAVIGRNEHARRSPRHPYPKPGTVEVSLLRTTKSSGGSSRK
jgi:hypothetical protein